MLARIVENWLTSATETGYQNVFAQMLANEGFRVLHEPVHHPFEHGKDIVAIAPDGDIYAFQLKDGDIDLKAFERYQGQLFALTSAAVAHPGVDPPRPPDKVYFVTNGRLTTPARDRLRALNDTGRHLRLPNIALIELDQLVGRLVDAHGSFLPDDLTQFNEILSLVVSDGQNPFPVSRFARMLEAVVTPCITDTSRSPKRALAATTILTSYVVGPWARHSNHLALVEAWLVASFNAMWLAEVMDLEEDNWLPTFLIGQQSAHQSQMALVLEALGTQDLVVPDIIEGFFYPVRATLICGYAAALVVAGPEQGETPVSDDQVKALLLRELDFVQISGEAGVPYLVIIMAALEKLGEPIKALEIAMNWAMALIDRNQPGSKEPIPDPYHSLEEILANSVQSSTSLEEEQFAGEAYTLHLSLEWFARRNIRQAVQRLWPEATKLLFTTFVPAHPSGLLRQHNNDGRQHTVAPQLTQSWLELRSIATTLKESALPARLWQHLYMLPYLLLLYPHRYVRETAQALDFQVFRLVNLQLDMYPPVSD